MSIWNVPFRVEKVSPFCKIPFWDGCPSRIGGGVFFGETDLNRNPPWNGNGEFLTKQNPLLGEPCWGKGFFISPKDGKNAGFLGEKR